MWWLHVVVGEQLSVDPHLPPCCLMLCCVFQASWLISFWLILLSILPTSFCDAGIPGLCNCVWLFTGVPGI